MRFFILFISFFFLYTIVSSKTCEKYNGIEYCCCTSSEITIINGYCSCGDGSNCETTCPTGSNGKGSNNTGEGISDGLKVGLIVGGVLFCICCTCGVVMCIGSLTNEGAKDSDCGNCILLILSCCCPPLSVCLKTGCDVQFWINLILTLICFCPGLLHSWWVISTYKKPEPSHINIQIQNPNQPSYHNNINNYATFPNNQSQPNMVNNQNDIPVYSVPPQYSDQYP